MVLVEVSEKPGVEGLSTEELSAEGLSADELSTDEEQQFAEELSAEDEHLSADELSTEEEQQSAEEVFTEEEQLSTEQQSAEELSADEEQQPAEQPAELPPAFYRVQHAGSHTFHDAAGFESRAHYHMDYRHYITPDKIHRHLDPLDRPQESSPFISVFDNKNDAWRHAREQQRRSHRDIFVTRIDTGSLRPAVLDINLHSGLVRLPVWRNSPKACLKTTFVSTADARKYLRVDPTLSRESEWFGIDRIPRDMISGAERLV